ncbi:MAG TPA: thioredoxin family protein [Ktedonobacterales bacterium]|nr:thioredoxin family protein [Ktedonobacterales bacterium]
MAESRSSAALPVPDGIVAVVKEECPTCRLVAPVLAQLAQAGLPLTVYTQDDLAFPPGLDPRDDTALEMSYRLDIEIVPTLLRVADGHETVRVIGWSREQWEAFTGVRDLGPGLPEQRPGCGSRSVEPGIAEELAVRYGGERLRARGVPLGPLEDEIEACYGRGWSDGLPVVPPTRERVLRMLEGTAREPSEIVAVVPPDMVACSVEKVAINAVMAGCRPEYMPVVLAAVAAACTDEFNMHGLLATTYASGPVVIVNGPIARAVGMNSGGNALGQGNRANATIGRALQLVVRNVGGGRPGEVDRATLGNPGKYTFCFAEDEEGSPWEPLSVERGVAAGASAVTLFAGEGTRAVVDQLSRTPESLARSFAWCLRTVAHPKLALAFDAFMVVSPDHARVFREAGWTKTRLRDELTALLTLPGAELVRGVDGCAEGMPETLAGADIPKFRPGGLWIVHAGGTAGLFSAIIGGWISGATGSQPVTREVTR